MFSIIWFLAGVAVGYLFPKLVTAALSKITGK